MIMVEMLVATLIHTVLTMVVVVLVGGGGSVGSYGGGSESFADESTLKDRCS